MATSASTPSVTQPGRATLDIIERALKHAPEELAAVIRRVTTTGSVTARQMVVDPLRRYSTGATIAQKYGYIEPPEERAESIRIDLMELWNAGNVAEETRRVGEVNFTDEGNFVYLEHSVRETLTDDQWRGYAALRLALEPLVDQGIGVQTGDVLEFVDWAIERDLGEVIALARERGTMEVPTLDALMEASTAPAMLSGTL